MGTRQAKQAFDEALARQGHLPIQRPETSGLIGWSDELALTNAYGSISWLAR